MVVDMKRCLYIGLVVISLISIIDISNAGSKRPVIIVENFKEIAGPGNGDYSAGLARIIADDLRALPSVEVITPDMRKSALDELAYSQLGLTSETNKNATFLAADYIILGSYQIIGDTVTVTIQLVRVSDQTVVESAKAEGTKEKIQERADAALFMLISLLEENGILDKTFSDEGATSVEQKRTAENNAFRYYSLASAKRYTDPVTALNLYKKAIISDPSYVNALIDGAVVASTDLALHDTAIKFIDKAERVVQQQGQRWSPLFARLMTARGEIYININKIPAAIESLNSAINMLKYIERGESFEMSEVLNDYGLVLRRTGRFDEAYRAYEESLKIKKSLSMVETLAYAETMTNIAALYRYQKKYDDALEWNSQAKKVKAKLGLKQSRTYALSLSNEGIIFCDKKDYSKAVTQFKQAAGIMEEINLENTDDYAGMLTNSGFALLSLNDNDQAEIPFRRAQSIREKINRSDTVEYAETSIGIARCLSVKGKYCEALAEVKKAVMLKKKLGVISDTDNILLIELKQKCN